MDRFNIYLQNIQKNTFTIKVKCSVSMKKMKKDVVVTLKRKSSRVEKVKFSCPTGVSSYCNHLIVLLFKILIYSLKGLTEVLQEVSCNGYAGK